MLGSILAAYFLGLCVFTMTLVIAPNVAYIPGHMAAAISCPVCFVVLLALLRRKT